MKSYHREFQPFELGESRWFFPSPQFEAPKALTLSMARKCN